MNCQLLKGRKLVPIEKTPGFFNVGGTKLWKDNEEVIVYVQDNHCLFNLTGVLKLFDVDVATALGKFKVKNLTDYKTINGTKTYVKCIANIHKVPEEMVLRKIEGSKKIAGLYGREEMIPHLLLWGLPEQVIKTIDLFPVLILDEIEESEDEDEDELQQRLDAMEQRLQRVEALLEIDQLK